MSNNKLLTARENKGWSTKYVAEQLGVTKLRYSNWERGGTFNMRDKTKICKLFGASLHELGLAENTGVCIKEPEPQENRHA